MYCGVGGHTLGYVIPFKLHLIANKTSHFLR